MNDRRLDALRDELNFLATNWLPRRALCRGMARFSQIRHPWVRAASIALWRACSDLDLGDARKQRFESLHDCFIRELEPGARPLDPDPEVLVSPCDGIVGGCGRLDGLVAVQAKRRTYALDELLCDAALAEYYRDGSYVTLRLTATMYHRFHAPFDCCIEHVSYVAGDAWNVNPAAVERVDRLYCRNERAVVRARLRGQEHVKEHVLTLVPVAAILVASIRLHCLAGLFHLDYPGPNEFPCASDYARGAELGWFQHGSTVLVFAPAGFALCKGIESGARIRMGQALLRLPADRSQSGRFIKTDRNKTGT